MSEKFTEPDKQVGPVWPELQSLSHLGPDDQLRIKLLRGQVSALPVAEDYKAKLLHSIDIYQDQILARPKVFIAGGWDDLEAIQQVTLGDAVENWLSKQCEHGSNEEPRGKPRSVKSESGQTFRRKRLRIRSEEIKVGNKQRVLGGSMGEQPEYVNYNVKAYNSLNEFRRWRDEHGIQLKVFEIYDGGGFYYHICEFQTLEHAHVFMKHFNITGDRKLWAEDKDGHRHYLEGIMNRTVTCHNYGAKIVMGLQEGFSSRRIKKSEVVNYLRQLQNELIAEKKIYLSANCYTSSIVLGGQVEPHLNLEFINYSRIPIHDNDSIAERIFKEAVENIATRLMNKFSQNRVVIQFHDSNVMLEKTRDIDPRISK